MSEEELAELDARRAAIAQHGYSDEQTCLEWAIASHGMYESFLVYFIITIYILQAQFFTKSCEIK